MNCDKFWRVRIRNQRRCGVADWSKRNICKRVLANFNDFSTVEREVHGLTCYRRRSKTHARAVELCVSPSQPSVGSGEACIHLVISDWYSCLALHDSTVEIVNAWFLLIGYCCEKAGVLSTMVICNHLRK